MPYGRMRPVALAGILCLTAAPAMRAQTLPPAGTRIVYVNVQEVVQATPGAKEAKATFDSELSKSNDEFTKMASVVDSMVRDYQRQEVMLSPQAKQSKQQEILDKQKDLQGKKTDMENQLSQRQQELLQPILQRVSAVIEQIRKENNYDIVMDAANGGIVAADPKLDITSFVLDRVKSGSTTTAADTSSSSGKPGS